MSNGYARRSEWAFPALLLSMLLLSGCENSVNPNFQQDLQTARSGSQDDRYAPLERAPRIGELTRWKVEERQARASGAAQVFEQTYESMLKQLDSETVGSRVDALFAACRTTFSQVLSYQTQHASDASAAAASMDPVAIFSDLHRCREQAVQFGPSDDKGTEALLQTLRRFSSAGMILIGVSVIGQGDEPAGLKLWKGGDALLDEDLAGFKLSLDAFRG